MRANLSDGGVVSAVLSNNKAIREFNYSNKDNKLESVIYLCFNSDYTIVLKNQTKRKAGVMIYVDGSPISDNFFIVESNQIITVDRWMLDKNGKSLHFVPIKNDNIEAKENKENSKVHVEWYFEDEIYKIEEDILDTLKKMNTDNIQPLPYIPPVIPQIPFIPLAPYEYDPNKKFPNFPTPGPYEVSPNPIWIAPRCPSIQAPFSERFRYSDHTCSNQSSNSNMNSIGFTKEGKTIKNVQPPPSGNMITTKPELSMTFYIRGSEKETSVKSTKKINCNCGKSIKRKFVFCPHCGQKQN